MKARGDGTTHMLEFGYELRLAKLAALACEAHMANKRWPFSMIGYRVSVYTAIICYI